MAEKFLADTTFIIDFIREQKRGVTGDATDFLIKNSKATIFLSIVSLGELEEGFQVNNIKNVDVLTKPFPLLYLSKNTAKVFGSHSAILRAKGQMIGDNDLWIASVALEHEMPILTANVKHFSRVGNLKVIKY